VQGSPTTFTDPNGYFLTLIVIIFIGAVIGGVVDVAI